MTSLPSNEGFNTFASSGHLTPLADGNFLAVWIEVSSTGSGAENGAIFGTVLNANGQAISGAFTIASAAETDYTDITATTLTDGSTVVAWTQVDGSGHFIKAQVLNASHQLTGGPLSVANAQVGSQAAPQIYALANGNFSVLYSGSTGSGTNFYNTVATKAGGSWNYSYHEVPNSPDVTTPMIVLPNGNFAALVAVSSGSNGGIGAYVWAPDTDPGNGQLVDQIPGFTGTHPFLAPLKDGRLVAAWEDVSDTDSHHYIHAQVLDATGAASGPAFSFAKPDGTIQDTPVITQLANGGFAIAFTVQNGSDENVYTAACDANGTIVSDTAAVGHTTAGDQYSPSLIALANGSYAVSWMSQESDGYKLLTEAFGASVTSSGGSTIPGGGGGSGGVVGTPSQGNDTQTGSSGDEILKGLGGNDVLNGGAGNDTIYGGAGHDVLTGGSGKDFFVFDMRPTNANSDKITDFSHAQGDRIYLDNAFFKMLGKKGTLKAPAHVKASLFHVGKATAQDSHVLIFDSKAEKLYYNPDGAGHQSPALIASFAPHTKIALSDLWVV